MLEHRETIEAIEDQITDFDNEIELEEALKFKQKDHIKRVRYYDHSTYETGNVGIVEGIRVEKPFENISTTAGMYGYVLMTLTLKILSSYQMNQSSRPMRWFTLRRFRTRCMTSVWVIPLTVLGGNVLLMEQE